MRVAVASDANKVAQHFGHCEGFQVFDVQGAQIHTRQFYPNPGHKPGFLPNYLHELGVTTIISGGMGGGAVGIFAEKGIEVVTGAVGDCEAAATAYIAGELKSSGSICKEHAHSDSCGGR